MMLGADEFANAARPFVEAAGIPSDDRYPEAARAVQEKVRLLSEVPKHIDFLYAGEIEIDPEALEKLKSHADAPALLAALADTLAALPDWSGETAKAAIGETAKARSVKPGKLMFPTRVALSGRTAGPDLSAILAILGREEAVRRIRKAVEILKG